MHRANSRKLFFNCRSGCRCASRQTCKLWLNFRLTAAWLRTRFTEGPVLNSQAHPQHPLRPLPPTAGKLLFLSRFRTAQAAACRTAIEKQARHPGLHQAAAPRSTRPAKSAVPSPAADASSISNSSTAASASAGRHQPVNAVRTEPRRRSARRSAPPRCQQAGGGPTLHRHCCWAL